MIAFLKDDSNRLAVMLGLSIAVHAVLLSLKFAAPELKRLQDHLPALDVVLVNAKTKSAPTKADALAQTNLDRGGNTEAERRMKSPLPVPKTIPLDLSVRQAAEARPVSEQAVPTQARVELKQRRVAELEKQAREVMTQIKPSHPVLSQPSQSAAASAPENALQEAGPRKATAAELVAQSMDAARLEAEISRDWDSYQKLPRRKFIGSRVREYRFSAYVEAWRQKVEKVGTLNYPEEAKAQKLYGSLRVTVNIKSDGSIESIELNQSSGHKVLDDSARRIVELAAPYAEFPADVRRDTDIISITRTWTFTREDTLSGGGE
ncbi:gram-negative bacterial tonB protein [mine drainage metagenome]|uniref:Gram-negative bacterial tonB protein n=1 Tax=mine drainage metagenome TaxID=410659 RepID=A0A1J5RKX1_9ZZZZ